MQTLNQHISILRTFANNHYQINDFGVGDPWELNSSGSMTYPLMWTEVVGTNVDEGTMTDEYRIHLYDLVRHDEINEQDVLSDMKLVAIDLLAYLQKSSALGHWSALVKSASIEFATEAMDDRVSGVILSLTLEQPVLYDYCNIPIAARPSSGQICPDVTIYDSNGNVIATVSAGGSYTTAAGSNVTVTVNGAAWSTESCGNTANIPVQNTAGTPLGSKVGGIWTIPSIVFTDSYGSSGSVTAGTNITATQTSALSCYQLNTPAIGLTIAQRKLVQIVPSVRTGQTTSYANEDDGALQLGRGASFSTLDCNNPFGNTNRFTDRQGGQSFTSNIVVDWITGLMWYRIPSTNQDTWSVAMSASSGVTTAGYTDWFIPNYMQLAGIMNFGQTNTLNYSPFNINATTYASIWTSTTNPNATTQAFRAQPTTGQMTVINKTSTSYYIWCRVFSFTDLGL